MSSQARTHKLYPTLMHHERRPAMQHTSPHFRRACPSHNPRRTKRERKRDPRSSSDPSVYACFRPYHFQLKLYRPHEASWPFPRKHRRLWSWRPRPIGAGSRCVRPRSGVLRVRSGRVCAIGRERGISVVAIGMNCVWDRVVSDGREEGYRIVRVIWCDGWGGRAGDAYAAKVDLEV